MNNVNMMPNMHNMHNMHNMPKTLAHSGDAAQFAKANTGKSPPTATTRRANSGATCTRARR